MQQCFPIVQSAPTCLCPPPSSPLSPCVCAHPYRPGCPVPNSVCACCLRDNNCGGGGGKAHHHGGGGWIPAVRAGLACARPQPHPLGGASSPACPCLKAASASHQPAIVSRVRARRLQQQATLPPPSFLSGGAAGITHLSPLWLPRMVGWRGARWGGGGAVGCFPHACVRRLPQVHRPPRCCCSSSPQSSPCKRAWPRKRRRRAVRGAGPGGGGAHLTQANSRCFPHRVQEGARPEIRSGKRPTERPTYLAGGWEAAAEAGCRRAAAWAPPEWWWGRGRGLRAGGG